MKRVYIISLLILMSWISLFTGVTDISISGIISGNNHETMVMTISRIPRLLSIIAAGAGMSIAGLIMQNISRNKFVSPTTGATLDSAQLGIVIAMIIIPGASIMAKASVAFGFAIIGTGLFMSVLGKIKFKNAIFVPLVGIMVGNVIGSVTSMLGYKYNLSQNVSAWMQGDFSMIIKGNYEILYITIPLIFIAYKYAHRFTIAGMGEDFSKNLGLSYKKTVNTGLVIVALITVCVVITAGSIPYIGLIVPNIVSMYKGDNTKNIIMYTALTGIIFVMACDILGRIIIYPYEISIGLTVGVLGSIIFLYLITRRSSYAS